MLQQVLLGHVGQSSASFAQQQLLLGLLIKALLHVLSLLLAV